MGSISNSYSSTQPNSLTAISTGASRDWSKWCFDPDASIPADVPIFSGFLCKEDLCLWIGREKHRKSSVLLQLAICAAVGLDFLTFHCEVPVRVVYVDYETKTLSLKQRYDAVVRSLKLTEAQQRLLKQNLDIVEVRRAAKSGAIFPRFGAGKENENAEKFWRKFSDAHPADLYIFDPMRCMHSGDENDSKIELLFASLRTVFRGASIIISHHMRKQGDMYTPLKQEMRRWSDNARGSVALKAHADVIVCQEREPENGASEVVYWGAFLKDGADIEPMPLEETDAQSFCWRVTFDVPEYLREVYDALRRSGGPFASKSAMFDVVSRLKSKSSAYRQLDQLIQRGLLSKDVSGRFVLAQPQISGCCGNL